MSNNKQVKNNKDKNSSNYNPKHKTFRYKHVEVNKVRPKLTKGNYESKAVKKERKKISGIQKDKNAKLKIIPLGGLDAIGNNMTVFECEHCTMLCDAGLMFPGEGQPGIDLILPDYTYVLEKADKLRAIVITHGHEDHIGALPYLIKDLDKNIPIYATKLTIGLIKLKFEEFDIDYKSFVEVKPGDVVKFGEVQISFFRVCHSIPDAVGIFLQTPAGNVLHTGDFKLDLTPIDGQNIDLALISKFSKIGIDLMMSDSTNATRKEVPKSESTVGPALEDIIRKSKGKVIIASFASHIHRIQQVCDAAKACGRKVVVAGRSMVQNIELARKLGYLFISDDDIIDAYDLNSMPSDSTVILCTGSQGEPLSALARIADGVHKTVDVEEGDTVIMSAMPVPGNEKAVATVSNKLIKQGVNVYDRTNSHVHVSGHAGAEGLKIMLSLCEPYAFLPVHGEAQHLMAHAKIAEALGVNTNNIFVCDNGDVVELTTSGVKRNGQVQSGFVFVDGLSVGDTSAGVLDERNCLGEKGIAIISMALDINARKIKGPVYITLRGISGEDDADLSDDIRNTVVKTVNNELKTSGDIKHIKKQARGALLSVL